MAYVLTCDEVFKLNYPEKVWTGCCESCHEDTEWGYDLCWDVNSDSMVCCRAI